MEKIIMPDSSPLAETRLRTQAEAARLLAAIFEDTETALSPEANLFKGLVEEHKQMMKENWRLNELLEKTRQQARNRRSALSFRRFLSLSSPPSTVIAESKRKEVSFSDLGGTRCFVTLPRTEAIRFTPARNRSRPGSDGTLTVLSEGKVTDYAMEGQDWKAFSHAVINTAGADTRYHPLYPSKMDFVLGNPQALINLAQICYMRIEDGSLNVGIDMGHFSQTALSKLKMHFSAYGRSICGAGSIIHHFWPTTYANLARLNAIVFDFGQREITEKVKIDWANFYAQTNGKKYSFNRSDLTQGLEALDSTCTLTKIQGPAIIMLLNGVETVIAENCVRPANSRISLSDRVVNGILTTRLAALATNAAPPPAP